MIDFLKIDISYLDTQYLLSNKGLDFNCRLDLATSEEILPYRAKDYDYNFKINPIVKEMTGSIHKTINFIDQRGNHNYNDLSINRLTTELERLYLDYGIDPSRTRIRGLEYGINIEVDHSPSTIITNNVVAWDKYPVSRNMTYSGRGRYYEWRQSQFHVKIYDKSDQYNLINKVMRFEKKVIKSEYINKMGLCYLSDINKIEILKILTTDLLHTYDKLIFIDKFDPSVLNQKDKLVWSKLINPKYWEHYSKGAQSALMRKRHQRLKERFNAIVDQHQLEGTKQLYRRRMESKIERFLNVTE